MSGSGIDYDVLAGKRECPRVGDHTPMPTGYLARVDWYREQWDAGRRPSRCRGCGLYAVWDSTVKTW